MTTTPTAEPHEDPAACDCTMSRRSALRTLALAGMLGAGFVTSPGGARFAFAAGSATDVLVVLSLRGGFDGLSAVVPVGDPHYAAVRGNSAVPLGSAIQLDQTFGLHPALAPLKPFWDDGTFATVVDVGQVAGTRSHFDAMAEMERAAPGSTLRTGWIDRLIALAPSNGLFTATQVGSTAAPQSFIGSQVEMTVDSIEEFTLSGASTATEIANWTTALRGMHAGGSALISAPVTRAMDALATINQVKAASPAPYTPPAAYPRDSNGNPTALARALDDTARMMKANVGLRVVTIDCGNWDMHEYAGVNDGWMRNQLADVAGSLAAFAADLGPLFAGTTVVTLSEFGRRVAGNGTGGFDHGHGNQVFLLGGGVNGGKVHGTWGGLAPADLVRGDLPGRNDYRSLLGAILTRRMAVSSAEVATVFPNPPATYLDVVRPR